MNEYRPQSDPNLSAVAEAEITRERIRQEQAANFKATLDPDQQEVFEGIFGPIGQIELERQQELTGSFCLTRFGLFPEDPSPEQSAIHALIDADRLEHTYRMLPRGSIARKRCLAEAKALRVRAKELATQA